jgi:probable phosphoglycerate mutase
MQTEKIVYFVRHGQSEDNASPVFQSPDSPLSTKGREQAQKIAERVAKVPFDVLISSSFRRAEETAKFIAKATGKSVEYSNLFVERTKPASVNGKPHTDEAASALWKKWNESLYVPGMRAEDGENFDDITLRANKALEYLHARPEQSIVVVTHGYFLRTMLARVLVGGSLTGEIFKKFQRGAMMENTGLTLLEYQSGGEEDSRWRLWVYNDHAHLG